MRKNEINTLATEITGRLIARDYTLATAESCTGGAIAAAITSIAGCSAVFNGTVVAYCNAVKSSVLGVEKSTLDEWGAVSEPVVREMVAGVKKTMGTVCAIATSGIAGPGGGTPSKPVGTVWVAVSVGDRIATRMLRLVDAGRVRNIENAVAECLAFFLEMLREE